MHILAVWIFGVACGWTFGLWYMMRDIKTPREEEKNDEIFW